MAGRQELVLPGGTITVDASTVVPNGNAIIVLGAPAHAWESTANGAILRTSAQPLIGVVKDSAGAVRRVFAPAVDGRVYDIKAVSAGAAGWYIVFAVGKQGTSTSAFAFETARLWAGTYDGHQWTDVKVVAQVRNASLEPGVSSNLVVSGDTLAFAYPFEDASAGTVGRSKVEGMVLLTRAGGTWSADTLRTWEAPRSIQLVVNQNAGLWVIYSQSYFSQGRSHAPALFAVRHKRGWLAPNLLVEATNGYVGTLKAARNGADNVIVTWRVRRSNAENAVDWGMLRSDGRFATHGRIGALDMLDRLVMVPVKTGLTAWVLPIAHDENHVMVVLDEREKNRHAATTLSLPSEGRVVGAALMGRSIVVVTLERGGTPSAVPQMSLTMISLACASQ